MGLTKSVQPYCRLAIIDMQMTPRLSCHQRPRRIETAFSPAIEAASVMLGRPRVQGAASISRETAVGEEVGAPGARARAARQLEGIRRARLSLGMHSEPADDARHRLWIESRVWRVVAGPRLPSVQLLASPWLVLEHVIRILRKDEAHIGVSGGGVLQSLTIGVPVDLDVLPTDDDERRYRDAGDERGAVRHPELPCEWQIRGGRQAVEQLTDTGGKRWIGIHRLTREKARDRLVVKAHHIVAIRDGGDLRRDLRSSDRAD